jgi:TonB-linked SusC/RagA family outer membrane protein
MNPDGTYSKSDRNLDVVEIANPITTAVHNRGQGTGLNYQFALYAEIEPIKGLIYRAQASVSGDYGKEQVSNDSYTGGVAGDATLPTRLRKTFNFGISPIFEQYITYKKGIGKHDFSVMAGNFWRSASSGGTIEVFGEGLDLSIESVKTAPTNLATKDEIWKDASLAYFGRINYQFNNRYLLTANLRADASPRFAPSNRWAKFPSVSLAWKMHEEAFIKDLNIFDQLKLRAGMGSSGSDNIGNFRYLSQVYTLNVYVPFGNDGTHANGATVINNSSNNIRWETTETTSIGADMAFLNNSLTFSADYYQKETSDILYEIPQPLSLGYGDSGSSGSAIVNAASMENKGIELQLGYRSKIGELNYSVNANYTNNKNNVISLGDGSYIDGVNRTDLGHPLGYYYGHIADGIFMKQSELDAANAAAVAKGWPTYQDGTTRAGDVRFKDVNGDGHVDDNDRTYLGTPHPKHLFGLNINLDYKGFDLNVILQGIAGSEIYDGNYNRQRGGQNILNQFTYVLDRWKSEAEPGNGIVPRVAIGDPARNNRFSTLKLTSGNYLKARQISLGYTIPSAFSSRIGIDNIRIYASADNYFTFSKWKYGYDPEVGGNNLSRGADGGNHWPNPKLLMFGFQIRL